MGRKDEITAKIIEAATQEFLTKSVDAASMHNIAEIAEVSKRTLYKYYSNKEELYSALIDELLNSMSDMYQNIYTPDIPIREQVEKIVERKIELTTTDSFINMSKIVIAEIIKLRTPSIEQMKRISNNETVFVQWINEAKKDKKINSNLDAQTIGEQFHSILKGQIFFPVILNIIDIKTINLKVVKERTVDFFINSFCTSKN